MSRQVFLLKPDSCPFNWCYNFHYKFHRGQSGCPAFSNCCLSEPLDKYPHTLSNTGCAHCPKGGHRFMKVLQCHEIFTLQFCSIYYRKWPWIREDIRSNFLFRLKKMIFFSSSRAIYTPLQSLYSMQKKLEVMLDSPRCHLKNYLKNLKIIKMLYH